jgi:hypothetical protein
MSEGALQLAAAVEGALSDLRREFGRADAEAVGDGGAFVTVAELEIGERWEPPVIDLTFLLPFNFPYNYIYPFYTDASLERVDGGAWPQALQRVSWRGRDAIQISLRPNRWRPEHETASSLVYLVQHWFRALA